MHLIPFDPTALIAESDEHPAQAPDIVGRWTLGQVWYSLRRRADGCYVLKVRNPNAETSARFVLRDDDMCNLFVLSETVPTQTPGSVWPWREWQTNSTKR